MKILIFITGFLLCSGVYGQNDEQLTNVLSTVKSIHWITKKCSDLQNHYENDICFKNGINNYITKNLDWLLVDKAPSGQYDIRISIMVEEDGTITKVAANSDMPELNEDLEGILMRYQNTIQFVDQDGTAYKNRLIFPLKLMVE